MSFTEEMLEAAKSGNVEAARSLLKQDQTLAGARSATGESTVLLAVYHGHDELAKLLAESGTPLDVFEASALGRADRVRALVQSEPGLANSYSHDGWTPLHLAAFFGRAEAAQALIASGAGLDALAKNGNANTPLQAAVASRKAKLAQILIDARADVNAKTGYGWTALQIAAHNGDMEIARLLIQSSADPKACNDKGQTAAAIAAESGHEELATFLKLKEQES